MPSWVKKIDWVRTAICLAVSVVAGFALSNPAAAIVIALSSGYMGYKIADDITG